MSASYPYRRSGIAVRVVNALAATCFLVGAALEFASHHLIAAVIMLVSVVLNGGLFVLNTKTAARRRMAARPRPDYALIASMEREVYGETFRHDGSPVADAFALARHATDEMADWIADPDDESAPALPMPCPNCGRRRAHSRGAGCVSGAWPQGWR